MLGERQQRRRVEGEGGHGNHVHWTTTTEEAMGWDSTSPQTRPTRGQPRQHGDSDFTGSRMALASTGAQQDKAPHLALVRTANSPGARRGDTSSPGLLAQQSLLRRGGDGVVVGHGCGGDHLWDGGEEAPCYQGSGGGCTSADSHARAVGQPAQAGCSNCRTLTTFSSNHP